MARMRELITTSPPAIDFPDFGLGDSLGGVGGELRLELCSHAGFEVDAVDGDAAFELGGFLGDEPGGEVAGAFGEVGQLVGERALDEDGAEVGEGGGGLPDF